MKSFDTFISELRQALLSEAVGDASSPEAVASKYNKMKDADDIDGAAMLLANFLQNKKAIKCLRLAKQIHESEKAMPEEIKDRKTDGFNVVDIFKYSARWSSYLWKDFAIKYPQVKQ
jgi:hypothetical protein